MNPFTQQAPITGVKHIIAVGSGKGGVGKSTVAVNLVSDSNAGTVTRVDSATGKILGTAQVGGSPADGDVLDGVAWFGDQVTGTVVSVDQAGKAGPAHPGGVISAFVVCVYQDSLWIADFKGTDVVRVDPRAITG